MGVEGEDPLSTDKQIPLFQVLNSSLRPSASDRKIVLRPLHVFTKVSKERFVLSMSIVSAQWKLKQEMQLKVSLVYIKSQVGGESCRTCSLNCLKDVSWVGSGTRWWNTDTELKEYAQGSGFENK